MQLRSDRESLRRYRDLGWTVGGVALLSGGRVLPPPPHAQERHAILVLTKGSADTACLWEARCGLVCRTGEWWLIVRSGTLARTWRASL